MLSDVSLRDTRVWNTLQHIYAITMDSVGDRERLGKKIDVTEGKVAKSLNSSNGTFRFQQVTHEWSPWIAD